MKLIKNVAIEKNKFFTFEKEGDFFVHTSITERFSDRLGLLRSDIECKNLFQIFPKEQALINSKFYNAAWGGEETFFHVNDCLFSAITIYVVLSPVFLNGDVVSVIGHGAPALYVPAKLTGIIKKAMIL